MADNEAFSIDAFRLGAGYSRPEIAYAAHVTPPIGSRNSLWSQGIVTFSNVAVLMVTLDERQACLRVRGSVRGLSVLVAKPELTNTAVPENSPHHE